MEYLLNSVGDKNESGGAIKMRGSPVGSKNQEARNIAFVTPKFW